MPPLRQKVAVILLVAGVQVSIPALGHATIMVVQKILTWVFVFFFLLVTLILARVFTPHMNLAHLAQHAIEVEPSDG